MIPMSSGPDELTRITAFISAGIATLSLVISYFAYLRSGPRVYVQLNTKDYIETFHGKPVLRLTIANQRTHPVQIMYWRIYEGASSGVRYSALHKGTVGYRPLLMDREQKDGQKLPMKLDGYHSVSWDIETDSIATHMRFKIRFKTAAYVEVGLGSGKRIHGKSSYLVRQELKAYKKEKRSSVRHD